MKIKNKKNKNIKKEERKVDQKTFLIFFVISFFVGFLTVYFLLPKKNQPVKIGKESAGEKKISYSSQKVKEFLTFKNSLYYDPLDLIDDLKKQRKEILLVDCRDKDSFTKGHIKTAVNFQSINQILELTKKSKKTVILYGNYQEEPKINQIALDLLGKGLKVRVLSVGYNQFRHLKIFWLPESQWDKVNPEEWVEE